jgi:hypothetical protein
MSYESSIRAINIAQANFFRFSQLGENDERIGKALEILRRLKAEHRATFGTLVRVDGKWI